MPSQLRSAQRAFSLIELMIVVAIVAILAAIAIPQYTIYILRARQSETTTLLSAAKTAELSTLSAYDCYVAIQPNPPTPPGPTPQTWSSAGTNPGARYCPQPIHIFSFEDVGVRPISHQVNYQYACTAQYANQTGPTDEFACTAYGDLDGDGAYFELVACTDEAMTGMCIPTWQSTVSLFANDIVRISSAPF